MNEIIDGARRYDVAKFTDRELRDELSNNPPRRRSGAYLAALANECDARGISLYRDAEGNAVPHDEVQS